MRAIGERRTKIPTVSIAQLMTILLIRLWQLTMFGFGVFGLLSRAKCRSRSFLWNACSFSVPEQFLLVFAVCCRKVGAMPAQRQAAASHGAENSREQFPSPHRKLTDDEVKTCADRLSRPVIHGAEPLPPLIERRVISKEQLDNSVQKLYTQSINRKKQMMDEISKKREKEEGVTETKVIPSIDLDCTFERLYTQQMELKRKSELILKEQKMQERAKAKRFQNRDEQTESAKRLCDATIEKAREAHRNLFEKYVTSTAPAYRKMTKEELATSAARLTRKE
jgi:hypothetical protein